MDGTHRNVLAFNWVNNQRIREVGGGSALYHLFLKNGSPVVHGDWMLLDYDLLLTLERGKLLNGDWGLLLLWKR